MNHIKKAEIVFPEVSDRKMHVQRKISVETGKKVERSKFEDVCEALGFSIIFTACFLIILAIITGVAGTQ
ncbi:hypothetical protein [Aporhodopirellula aestuarii]|uniref:Uncharacterized protein n=1 Tax=Aporhodopirellula aestuarii TaxID=2950107 RepID=A0ABT0U563_9BACT|nr:hypothetical protein [Aporhodopirellula aestuarii]MCM2372079.1 hypothetical protein [Aporhodopirellula aestuarii]